MTDEAKSKAELDLATTPMTYNTLTAIANTEFVPKGLRGSPVKMLAAVMYGREIGITPMQALSNIHIIDGKPTPSAEMLTAKIRQSGHRMRAVAMDDKSCTVLGERVEDGEVVETMEFTYTIDMAKRANLTGKDNWKKYPEAMLYWRAASQLARMFFADCLIGFYTPDELGSADWHMEPAPFDDEAPSDMDEAMDIVEEVFDVEVIEETEAVDEDE